VCQGNNSVIFYGKPIGFEEFIIQKIEALDIIIDRRPEKRPKKKVDEWVSVPIILKYCAGRCTTKA
jgi:hypothetical protein